MISNVGRGGRRYLPYAFKLFLRDDQEILWLEDQDQNLRGQPTIVLDGFVGYRARRNYRSPDSIARFIRRTLPFKFEGANDLLASASG